MSRTVKLKARPGQVVSFPAVCVHCGRSSSAQMTLSHQEGRVTRLLDAPLCAACGQIANTLTAPEQRLQQIGWLAAGLAGVLVLAVGCWRRWPSSLFSSIFVAGAGWRPQQTSKPCVAQPN